MNSAILDFIIIGSGIAGLNAALEASKKGNVLVITKNKIYESNTWHAQGGIAAVRSKMDNFEKHIMDTLEAGAFHNDKKAATFIIKNGPRAIQKLLKMGMVFTKEKNGKMALGREGGHQEKRVLYRGDTSGKFIENVLIKKIKKNKSITVYENTFVKKILVKNKICWGVQIIKKNKLQNIFAKKIILATGGLGQIYEKTTNPFVATGDGLAMAKKAGCKMKDLEFIQFHPTAFNEKNNPRFLLSEALRGDGAILLNIKGERFMRHYHHLIELAPRDIVSRAIFKEEKKGPVYLKLNVEARKAQQRFPQISKYLKKKGLILGKDKIPITPAAHFSCGGIQTNLKGATNIKNLYAFGEVACTGLHGANRLASNSLLEGLVMSNQILKSASNRKISAQGWRKWSQVQKKFSVAKKVPLTATETQMASSFSLKIRNKLQKIMWDKVGIIRTEKKLKQALQELQDLKKKIPANLKIKSLNIELLETKNMLDVACLITKAALKRKRSLGTHFLENHLLENH